jgi:hypothetical protein
MREEDRGRLKKKDEEIGREMKQEEKGAERKREEGGEKK